MYLFETGLGQVFRPRSRRPSRPAPKASAQPPAQGVWVVKNGHRRFCPRVSATERIMTCDLVLKVNFRRSFEEFLRGVENAYVSWMARSDAQKLIKKLHGDLKKYHQDMSNLLNNDPITLTVGLSYRRSNGKWLVYDSQLRQWQGLIDI
jgi:hypothetical protein